jgi:hypothetical protein
MPQQQIPLVYGDGRNRKNLDYVTLFPVNMTPIARPIKDANGYMRSFQGLTKIKDTDGVSRGVNWNTVQQLPYRVMGGYLYKDSTQMGAVPNSGRVSMAHSRITVAVATGGILYLHNYNGTISQFSNWPITGQPTDVTFDWGNVFDVTRVRQRYIFSQQDSDTFWISSLEDESHPDRVAPFYRAESMPDGILALRSWRDYVVCFGSSTIEFFALTGDASQVYQSQPSYMIRQGIVGQFTVCNYLESFAFISSPANGSVSVMLMEASGGTASDLANYQVKEILAKYTVDQLSTSVLESIEIAASKFLIMHLPEETLCYDVVASQALGIQAWSILKTGITGSAGSDVYRGIDLCNHGDRISCGDRRTGQMANLDKTVSSQYGEDQEMILYTPLLYAPNMIVSEFEVDSSLGDENNPIKNLFLSGTEDGINYGQEKLVKYDSKLKWLGRTLWQRIGRIRTCFGLKIRAVGSAPVTMSKARVRID